jgi:hypothetical protein
MRRADADADDDAAENDKEEERRLTVATAPAGLGFGLHARAVLASNTREETQERRIMITTKTTTAPQKCESVY